MNGTKKEAWLWGLLFASVPVLTILGRYVAPASWWLPAPASTYAGEIDGLFNLILYVTAITFVLTNVLLVYTLVATRTEGKATYTHGNNTLELVWTAIPAAMLIFLALYQRSTWADIKQAMPEKPDLEIAVVAQQFKWDAIYDTNGDGRFDENEDFVSSRVIVPKGKKVLVHLQSKDVLHSFFLPQMRTKQDAVPGMIIPVWFEAMQSTDEYARDHKVKEQLLENLAGRLGTKWRPDQLDLLTDLVYTPQPIAPPAAQKAARAAYQEKEARVRKALGDTELFEQALAATLGQRPAGINQIRDWTYELVCAELCGLNHFYMRGSLLVLEPDEFDAWIKERTR